ncbi:tetratricopeptide repeat protein [Zoogloea dura]|jgi:TPR repeat protein|uniref:Sel1 repeat family protein n=1 Tax=Zoogloea dura TaxID=2728840 RepID=A0A848G9S3_9RHOO|nr:tetratricopeptide repeat protein [Zoogloea dura]NML27655.1 sel1 repeat family protein [Zoogloea dura]
MVHVPTRCTRIAALLLIVIAPMAHAELLGEDELADVIRKPAIGLYKGYAEFKMAHYAEARQIWTALSERGMGEAWFNLGILAEDGLGEPRDAAEARRRYEQAALAGSRNAALRLGISLQGNRLGAADPVAARRWLVLAAGMGDEEAAVQLAVLEGRSPVPLGPRDRRLAEARRLEADGNLVDAVTAYQGLADEGDARGVTRLAWLYEAGRGVPRNLDEAARLFRRAAEAGESEAGYALSVMLETGVGQARDPVEALRWLKAAAAGGYPPAVEALKAR